MTGSADPAAAGSDYEAAQAAAHAGKAEMKAEADRRIAAMGNGKPKSDNQPAGEAPRTPDGKFAAKDNTIAVPAQPEKTAVVPKPDKTVDRSFLTEFDDEFRKSFEALSPASQEKTLKILTAEGRKEADYRQKTMSVAEREKALVAEEETLRFGRVVLKDPEMFSAVKAVDDKRSGRPAAKPTTKEPFDHITATPEEFQAFLDDRDQRVAKSAVDQLRADLDAKDQAQSEKVVMATAAKAAFVDTGDYEPEVVNAVYEALVADGVKITKDNVVEKLKKWLPAPKPRTAPVNPPPAASTLLQAGGVSSLARAGGVTPMVTTPPFIQKGEPPSTRDDLSDRQKRIQEAVWMVNRKRDGAGRDLISLGSP